MIYRCRPMRVSVLLEDGRGDSDEKRSLESRASSELLEFLQSSTWNVSAGGESEARWSSFKSMCQVAESEGFILERADIDVVEIR